MTLRGNLRALSLSLVVLAKKPDALTIQDPEQAACLRRRKAAHPRAAGAASRPAQAKHRPWLDRAPRGDQDRSGERPWTR